MTATVIPFPSQRPRREPRIEVMRDRDGGGWLVITPRGYGDLYASLDTALADAKQIAASYGIGSVHLAEAIIGVEGGAA